MPKQKLPTFTMPFEPSTIDNLGHKLYGSLPPVVGEIVSNAWDADATRVEITLPTGKIDERSEIIVRDFGRGMNADELQDAYLPIGRNCRKALQREHSEKFKRHLMGRKGIGKLASFGIATEVDVRTIKNGHAICIRLNYDDIKSWPAGESYEPEIIPAKTGKTKEENGTEITVRKLKRKNVIDVVLVRKNLARRYTVIDKNFVVTVNGTEISPKDRRLREQCEKSWDANDLPGGNVINKKNGWNVSGWIGLVGKSSQVDRGVDVFAHNKAVELETMFGLASTHGQFARAYLVGEIHADFLDGDDDDISPGRNMVLWESEAGQALEAWGEKSIKFVLNEWSKMRRKKKEKQILDVGDFGVWLKSRSSREQKIARKLVKTIIDDQDVEPESTGPLLEIIKTNIEFRAFQELVDEIGQDGAGLQKLITLFGEWKLFEAREHLRLYEGRAEIMGKLSKFVDDGALEVKQIQPLFEENGWLVNPLWGEVTGQTTYTDLLRENFIEKKTIPETDRRIDILGYQVGGQLHIVELKRPEKTLSAKDLNQVEDYVDWAQANIVGTGPDSPSSVEGLLIVGKMNPDKQISLKVTRLAGSNIRVQTFRDLLHRSRSVYKAAEKKIQDIAPEYVKKKIEKHSIKKQKAKAKKKKS